MLQMTDVLGHPPISSAGQKLSYLMSLTLSLKKKSIPEVGWRSPGFNQRAEPTYS